MKRVILSIVIVAATSAIAGLQAQATTPSVQDARSAAVALHQHDTTLTTLIQAAEKECGGQAIAVRIHDTDYRGLGDRSSAGAKGADRNLGHRATGDAGVVYCVTCLMNRSQLRDVYVSANDGRVLGQYVATATSWNSRPAPIYGTNTPPDPYVYRRGITDNAWPPSIGERYYDEYRRAEADAVIYRQQNPISYDNRYDNRSYDRKGNDGDRRGIGRVLIATDVINAKARSAQGEELGYIDDVVLDMKDGRILYAVLVHGGVLGVGAKHFAIPFEELGDLRNGEVRLDVANSELDRQDGFDDEKWPQTANAYWSSKMSSPRSSSEPVTLWCKSSDLINGNCVNKEGKTIGQVDDLIMDADRELVAYAIVSCNESHALVAVPVAAMQVRDNGDAVVDLTSERMNDLDTFDNVHDRDWSSVRLNRHFHSQFGVPAYWESAAASSQIQP